MHVIILYYTCDHTLLYMRSYFTINAIILYYKCDHTLLFFLFTSVSEMLVGGWLEEHLSKAHIYILKAAVTVKVTYYFLFVCERKRITTRRRISPVTPVGCYFNGQFDCPIPCVGWCVWQVTFLHLHYNFFSFCWTF